MKILYVITSGDQGGAQKYVLELAEHLCGSVTPIQCVGVAVGTESPWLADQAKARGIPHHPVPHLVRELRPTYDILAFFELIQLIRKLQPDVVHANSSKAGILASVAGKLLGKKVIFTAHGFQYLEPMSKTSRFFYKFCERACRPFRDFVITVSERDRQQALADGVITEKKSAAIHNGIAPIQFLDRNAARTKLGLPLDAPVVGCVANFYKTKGIDILLESFARLPTPEGVADGGQARARTQFANAHLVLIGDGPERQNLEAVVQKYNMQDFVHFAGQLPNASSLLKAFDVFALASRKEGLPYTLLEALQAELPIIATNVGGNPEAVGPAGMLVPPEDPKALAIAMVALLANKNKAEQLIQTCKIQSGKFTHTKIFSATSKVYYKLT